MTDEELRTRAAFWRVVGLPLAVFGLVVALLELVVAGWIPIVGAPMLLLGGAMLVQAALHERRAEGRG